MPGISEESVSALRDSKSGKHVYFALIVKNGTTGGMIVNKSGKVPSKQIETEKNACSTNTAIIGRCFGTDGTLTVQTVKPVDTNGESLTKKLVKEAGFTHCEFVTDKDAEKPPLPMGTKPLPPTPNTPPTTSPQTTPTTTQQTGTEDPAAGMRKRLQGILEWCKANRDGLGTHDTVERVLPVAGQVRDALQTGNLREAQRLLQLIDRYVGPLPQSGGTPPPTSTGTTSPPTGTVPTGTTPTSTTRTGTKPPETTTTGGTDKATVLQNRLNKIIHWCTVNKDGLGTEDTVRNVAPVAKQVSEALKTGNLREAEQKLLMIEKYVGKIPDVGTTPPQTVPQGTTPPTTPPTTSPRTPPITPPTTPPTGTVPTGTTPPQTSRVQLQQTHTQKKLELERFKQNPEAGFSTPQAKEAIMSSKSALLKVITSERGSEDNISRKNMLGMDSKDAGYKKNVTDVVDKLTYDIEGVMSDPTKNSTECIKKVNDTIGLLAIQRAHYADMRGITDEKMLDQRRRKVAAIDKHINELKKISVELRKMMQIKMKPAMDYLKSLTAMAKDDPEGSKTAVEEFVKTLTENKQMRQDLFQAAGPDDCDTLMALLQHQPAVKDDQNIEEDWSKDLAKSRADDSEFMDKMCQTAVMTETADIKGKTTFFRLSTVATKLTTTYARNSPGGKAYCQSVSNRYAELTKGKGSMEVKSTKDGGTVSEKDAQKNMETHKQLINSMIDGLSETGDDVPPEIAKMCKLYTDAAKQVDPTDEEFVTTQSGGFLMLRVVCPTLTEAPGNELTAINKEHSKVVMKEKEKWIKSGKKSENFVAPEMSRSDKQRVAQLKESQKLVTMQSKILQNMSNGTEFKEKHMLPMNSMIKKDGNFSPTTEKLRSFLGKVAKRG